MFDSQYGAVFGSGIQYYLMNRLAGRVDYAFHAVGILGNMHAYTVSFLF
ncbi:MAG: hypothetical protein ONA69_06375 [candidate division KSB1 bacterium]|nr:hypothetical protein [candidate division KSB1 bacterium]MDZ7346408.1 hypothetical protein [candidate division KSB1 bacterium]